MRVIKGNIDKLLDKEVISFGNGEDYISAIITDEDYVMDAIGKLSKVYPNILRLEYQNKRTILANDNVDMIHDNVKKSVLELFCEFYKKQNYIDLDEERVKIIRNVIKSSREENE